jgi:L-arabinose isomerase
METIKIDDKVIRVDELPEQLQGIIALYELSLEEELDAKKSLGLREAARLELTRRIILGYREFEAATTKSGEVEDEADSPTS